MTDREKEIDKDRRAVELAALLLLIPVLKTAREHAGHAVAIGHNPGDAWKASFLGDDKIHQPGITEVLAYAAVASWMLGYWRSIASYAEAVHGHIIPMDAIRDAVTSRPAAVLRNAGASDELSEVIRGVGGPDALASRVMQAAQNAEAQAETISNRLVGQLTDLPLPEPIRFTTTGDALEVLSPDGIHYPTAIADQQAKVFEIIDRNGFGPDKVYTVRGIIEAQTVLSHEDGMDDANKRPELALALWGGYYRAVLDNKTTVQCRGLNGTTKAKDWPEWKRIHPPNHFGCRSAIVWLYRRPGELPPAEVEPHMTPEAWAKFDAEKLQMLEYLTRWN